MERGEIQTYIATTSTLVCKTRAINHSTTFPDDETPAMCALFLQLLDYIKLSVVVSIDTKDNNF